MSFQQVILYALGLVTAIFGVLSIGVGFFGLAKRRPILFPMLYYNGFVLLIFLLGLILSFIQFFSSRSTNNLFITVAPFILLVLIAWLAFSSRRQTSGYMILGIYDDTFRDAVTHALRKLNLPYQETISKIRLVSLNVDLQAQVTSWIGVATIHIKQPQHTQHLKNIADTMSQYYEHKSIKINGLAFASCVMIGICITALVLARAFF
jgi:hypothetical protein